MNVHPTNDYLQNITDIDEYDDLAPAGIIFNGIFNFQQFRSLAYQTFGPKTKLFCISPSQCCIIVDMNMNTMRTKYLRHIESLHFDIRKIFLKSPSKDKSIVSYVPVETFCSFDRAKYYLYFPNHDDSFIPNEQFFPISSRIETNSIRSEYIAYEYNHYSELLQTYEFMLNKQFDQEIIVISPRFINELNSFIATNHNLLYISITKDDNYSEDRILELMNRTSQKPSFPTFIPYDQCYYLSFDPLIYRQPTRIDNPDNIYPLNHIRDIQISYIHKSIDESERLFEQPRTFIGFYDLVDLYRGYQYFSIEEPKSDLRIESSFQRKEYYSRLNISNQFYYIEVSYDFHQIDAEQYVYSIDFEDICYCGEDEEGHRIFAISFNNEQEFERIVYEFMNIMNLSFNIEELEIELFQDDDFSKQNYQRRHCCNCVRFQVRHSRHISANEASEQKYIKELIPSDFIITKEANQKYKITTQSKNEKTKLNSLYLKLHQQQRIKVFYPYSIHQQTKPIQEIHQQPTESKAETNQGIKTNIFKPKSNLYYLYFEENPKGKPLYPTNVVHSAFGLRNIQDLQRNSYLPNDQTQIRNYTFIGFKTKTEIKSALSTKSLISGGISGTFHEYFPNSESTNAIQNTKQDFNEIFSTTEVNQTNSTNTSLTSNEKDEKANLISVLETRKKSVKGKERHLINEGNIKPTDNSSGVITDDKSSINKAKEESQVKNKDQLKLDTNQNIAKPLEIAPNNQPFKKEQSKVMNKDTFVCNENLIYIYLKEKNQVRTNQSTKHEKKNLFGVKDCEHIQRYKFHPTKNDQVLYTFFGFLSYSKAQENIHILESKWISDGTIDIYETTEALEAYKETLNQAKQADLKSNEKAICQTLSPSGIPQTKPALKQKNANLFEVKDSEHFQKYELHLSKNDSSTNLTEIEKSIDQKFDIKQASNNDSTTKSIDQKTDTKQLLNNNVPMNSIDQNTYTDQLLSSTAQLKSNITKVKVNIYSVYDYPGRIKILQFSHDSFSKDFIDSFIKSSWEILGNILICIQKNQVGVHCSDFVSDYLVIKYNEVLNTLLLAQWGVTLRLRANTSISETWMKQATNNYCIYLINEKIIPKSILKPFIRHLKKLPDFLREERNVFYDIEIVSVFCYKNELDSRITSIENYLVNQKVAFDKKKYPLENTIIINEKLVLPNKADFDIIVDEIKSIHLSPTYVARNLLFVHHLPRPDNTSPDRHLLSQYSFIVLNSEKEKMYAVNHINSILYRNYKNVLKYNTDLFYAKYDCRKVEHQHRKDYLEALKKLPGIQDMQNNVYSIESPADRLYIGFDTAQHRQAYSTYTEIFAYDFYSFDRIFSFVPKENIFYLKVRGIDEKTFKDLTEFLGEDMRDVQSEKTIYRNLPIPFLKAEVVTYYFGFEEETKRRIARNVIEEISGAETILMGGSSSLPSLPMESILFHTIY